MIKLVFKKISCLKSNKQLTKLFLRDIHEGNNNPICKEEKYREQTLMMLDKLKFLDGLSRETPILEINKELKGIMDEENEEEITFDFGKKIDIDPLRLIDQEADSKFKLEMQSKFNNLLKEIEATRNELLK